MVFTGTYEHTIDAKNRLAIPAEIRNQIYAGERKSPDDPLYLYVILGDDATLCIYTEQQFEKRSDELDHSEQPSKEVLEYERVLFSLAGRIELDKQGRLRLPERLLGMTSLEKEVVLLGVKDHLEIRDRATWQAQVKKVLAENPGLLMNPRRVMKKAPRNDDD